MWLYGDFEKRPGLLGFLNSARKEHKGNCVRALVGWGQPDLDYLTAYESVAHLDLCVNVIKDGRNGMYAPVEAEVGIPDPKLSNRNADHKCCWILQSVSFCATSSILTRAD